MLVCKMSSCDAKCNDYSVTVKEMAQTVAE